MSSFFEEFMETLINIITSIFNTIGETINKFIFEHTTYFIIICICLGSYFIIRIILWIIKLKTYSINDSDSLIISSCLEDNSKSEDYENDLLVESEINEEDYLYSPFVKELPIDNKCPCCGSNLVNGRCDYCEYENYNCDKEL